MLSSIFAPLRSDRGMPAKFRDFRAFFEPKGGGPTLTIRPLLPEDKHELQMGFESLSPQTRFNRFFADVRQLSPEQWEYLTNVDGVDHVALVAVEPQANLTLERGVAVGRFMRLKDHPDAADVAITVVDSMQGKGLGTMMLRLLQQHARARGIKRFQMEVLHSNKPMLAVLKHFANVESVESDGEVDTLSMLL